MNSALKGIKVIDVSQVAAAPMAARHLGDFGADVVHVEPPATGDAWRAFQPGATASGAVGVEPPEGYVNYNWENYNRNKRGVSIDLAHKEGQDIIYRLVSSADVFITNLRMFERERFGLIAE